MATKKDKTRQQAQDWFIENFEATQKECAELFRVTEKTIGSWAKKYNWDDRRLDYHSSPVRIKQLLQRELLSVAQGNDPKLNAYNVRLLMSALDQCDRKADPIVVQRILKELDNFISQEEPAFATKCTPYHKRFLQHRIDLEA